MNRHRRPLGLSSFLQRHQRIVKGALLGLSQNLILNGSVDQIVKDVHDKGEGPQYFPKPLNVSRLREKLVRDVHDFGENNALDGPITSNNCDGLGNNELELYNKRSDDWLNGSAMDKVKFGSLEFQIVSNEDGVHVVDVGWMGSEMVHVIGPFGEPNQTQHCSNGEVSRVMTARGTRFLRMVNGLQGKEMNVQQSLPMFDELKQLGVISVLVVATGGS
ncbi:hypothetical protein VNO78_05560 [Psophocarpus tetragonolobus]|uniref:Uncharacterized protein n=1 Tax=Psophocarpus tetragonolobus TaxID=3891 RepID=A0AAN9XQU2_PSOTE